MQFSVLQTRTLKKLGESTTAPKKWSLAEIKDYLNEGYNDLVLVTGILETSGTLSTVANQYIYSLASDCLEVIRMFYETADRIIKPITFEKLTKKHRWFNHKTTAYPLLYANISTNKVFLYPKVTSSESSCITYWYKQIQTDMSDDTDTPDGPDVFHETMILFACHQALLKERNTSGQRKCLEYLAEYEEKKSWLEHHTHIRGGRKLFYRKSIGD
jgi:hypothetical protein